MKKRRKLTLTELLSIEIRLDTADEDEALQWFPLFYVRLNGSIHCQFFGTDTVLDKDKEITIELKEENMERRMRNEL